jgi:hypothetical protein
MAIVGLHSFARRIDYVGGSACFLVGRRIQRGTGNKLRVSFCGDRRHFGDDDRRRLVPASDTSYRLMKSDTCVADVVPLQTTSAAPGDASQVLAFVDRSMDSIHNTASAIRFEIEVETSMNGDVDTSQAYCLISTESFRIRPTESIGTTRELADHKPVGPSNGPLWSSALHAPATALPNSASSRDEVPLP